MSIHACESGENRLIHILLMYVGITLLKFLEIPFVVKPVEGSGPASVNTPLRQHSSSGL